MERITGTIQGVGGITGDLSSAGGLSGDISVPNIMLDPYEGPYTVTPSETAQTLETDGLVMTDDVSVGAIPDDYVGSAVPRRTKNDINITKIVMPGGVQKPVAIAAKGYYASTTTKDIPTGTATTPATSITENPTVSVDSNGLVTASVSASQSVTPTVSEGYVSSGTAGTVSVSGEGTLQLATLGATTYTPAKGSPTIITPGKYLTGDQTISAIPDTWYDMSAAMSWLGADATLVHEITPITVALKDTDFNTWTPSTTAATVVASQTLSAESQKYVATDLLKDGGYDYLNIWNMKIPIVYTGTPTQKAMPLFSCGLLIQSMFRRYSSFANLLDGDLNNGVTAQQTLATFERYYNSSGSLTYTNAASYGFYFANVAPTLSSASAQSPTITLKTPTMSARCSTTYLSTTNAGLVDKENTKLSMTCKVYRVRQDAYLQGFYRYLAARVAEMAS